MSRLHWGCRVLGPKIPALCSRQAKPDERRLCRLGLRWMALLAWLGASTAPAAALAAPATKTLLYHRYRLVVPASWPVYHLQTDPTACVRFDRHAVYLGRPGAEQRCAAHAAGRTEAILVEPLQGSASGASGAGGPIIPPSRASTSSARLVEATPGVIVTATWSRQPAVIERALGVGSVFALTAASKAQPAPVARRALAAHAAAAGNTRAASDLASVYTGLGFDACSTPSSAQMSAWSSSPYRAIGVYIGGTNMACSQANLTASWVSRQSAAGWHLVPIYVGLQAPSNDCGCASIAPGSATSQGAAAAADAVSEAQTIGLGTGNPLYVDMEGYNRTTTNTTAVLSFLASWTAHLHANAYQSGVYSSAGSGIVDLVSEIGTGYQEPDDIWIANWNGAQSTSDPGVPSADWAAHQRLHQYNGAHNESYGGVTINIDGDYLDGATATAGTIGSEVDSAPTLTVSPAPNGVIDLFPSWAGASGVSSWKVFAGAAPGSLAPVAYPAVAGAGTPIPVASAFPYFAVEALGSAGQMLGSSQAVATPSLVAIFGRAAYVPPRGLAGLPVGCVKGAPCQVTTTISAANSTLVSTHPETIPVGGGLAYFKLPPAAHAMLARASHHRLAVQITVRDVSGPSASRQLSLIPFKTSGPSPRRTVSQSAALRIIGTADFVSNGWVGGILAGCSAGSPCRASTTISAGGSVIARAGPQTLGVDELGYLMFTLTAAGHALVAQNRGNQLPANVTITSADATATARIALTSFS